MIICNPVLSYILGFLYGRGDLVGGVKEQLTRLRDYLADVRHLERGTGEETDRQRQINTLDISTRIRYYLYLDITFERLT